MYSSTTSVENIWKSNAGGWVESSRPPKIGQKCMPQKTRKQLNQPNLRFYFILWTKKSPWSNFVIWWDIRYSMIVQMPNNLVGANVMVWKLRMFTFRIQGLFDAWLPKLTLALSHEKHTSISAKYGGNMNWLKIKMKYIDFIIRKLPLLQDQKRVQCIKQKHIAFWETITSLI